MCPKWYFNCDTHIHTQIYWGDMIVVANCNFQFPCNAIRNDQHQFTIFIGRVLILFLYVFICSISFYSNRNPLVRVSIARVPDLFDIKCIMWPNETSGIYIYINAQRQIYRIDRYKKWMALCNNNESKHISGCIKSINTDHKNPL